MDLREEKTWVGAGAKIGGIAIVGADTFEGVATRIDSWESAWHEVNVTGIRVGIGLGGSIGASLFFAFNANTLWEINNTLVSDWGLNIAVPEVKANVKSVGMALNLSRFLDMNSKVFLRKEFVGSMTPEKLAKLRDIASFLFNSSDQFCRGQSGVLILDVPFAGTGAEASIFLTAGEFSVGGKI